MKKWVKPLTEVQNFVANEYVAACWGIECVVPQMPTGGALQGLGYHREETCGQKNNQSIREKADGTFEIAEINHDMTNRDLKVTIYPNGFNSQGYDSISLAQLESLDGKTIYWTTELTGLVTYKHHGTVDFVDGKSTNHS